MAGDGQETRLVLRAQSGDLDALDELLRLVQAPLHRYISGIVRDPQLAEDLLQEVFLRVYRKLGWLSDPALFRPWAYRIASRECFKRLPKERRWAGQVREPQILETLADPVPPADPPSDWIARIPELLDQLSPASRAVIVLHYIEEQSLDAVAGILGVPVGTVKSRLAYGLAQLRKEMGHAGKNG